MGNSRAMKSIYDLELHEDIQEPFMIIRRVPGGWIYEVWNEQDNSISCCFVPFNNEFQSNIKPKDNE